MSGRGRGSGLRRGMGRGQNSSQQNNSGKTEKRDSAAGSDIKKGKPGQSPRPPNRPLVHPTEEDKKKALETVNKNLGVKNGSNQKLESIGKEKEDISKELQTLAQELSITEGSPQEIIQAACR